MAFFVALVSASAFTPVDNSEAATDISATYDGKGYSLSLASYGGGGETEEEGRVSLDLTGTPDGAMAVEYDRLNVTTNSAGYKIYLSMNGADQKLLNTSLTESGEVCENPATKANCYFGPTGGTPAIPTALDVNTWGFALPKDVGSIATVANYGFDSNYVTSGGQISNGATGITTTTSAINTASKFAAVPAAGNEVVIAGDTAKAEAGKNYYVYYGVNANMGLTTGTYQGTVVYTALAEASSSANGEMKVSPIGQTNIDQSQSIVLATSLYASQTLLDNMGNISVKIGGKDCTNVSASKATGGTLNITCTTPVMNRWGTYDVVASVGEYGVFDLADGYSYYIPYATMAANPENYTMQQFTTQTCKEMPAPEHSDVRNYTGTIADDTYHAVGSYHTDKNHWYDYQGNQVDTNPVSEITLKDDRRVGSEYYSYRIRKLADGNCWMADNLRLTLDDSVALTSSDSDINYNMDTGEGWDGTDVTPRVISNPLKVNGPVLGTYSTDASTGVISWTPYVDTQASGVRGVSWGSPYSSCADANSDGKIVASECTMRASGGSSISDVTAEYFGPNAEAEEEKKPSTAIHVTNDALAEAARSYDNPDNETVGIEAAAGRYNDGDGLPQYYGTYYNWYAATAGSGTWASSTQWKDTENSVCPANWQLPDAATADDRSFQNLFITKYALVSGTGDNPGRSGDVAQKAPFSIIRSGVYDWASGILGSRGSHGLYWSRESNSPMSAYYLLFSSLYFHPQLANYKIYGFAVRCVAR
ncbi:MAG: FISUMP domain-containing protein [Candidatus Saccharibacteria bacterium]|nr:FISUMP domain-containing protein [Candidatus Saccharibacteria bacterium]